MDKNNISLFHFWNSCPFSNLLNFEKCWLIDAKINSSFLKRGKNGNYTLGSTYLVGIPRTTHSTGKPDAYVMPPGKSFIQFKATIAYIMYTNKTVPWNELIVDVMPIDACTIIGFVPRLRNFYCCCDGVSKNKQKQVLLSFLLSIKSRVLLTITCF